jgi:hypothetical protein
VPGRPKRLLVDEDAVDGGGDLEAGGSVDDVAHGHRLPFRYRGVESDVRFAGRNGDARLLSAVLLGEPVSNGERRADGSLSVVLVRHRSAEERRDGLADELLDPAAQTLELGANAAVVGSEERADVLRVELLSGRREIDELGREDADDLSLLSRRRRVRRRRTPAGEGGIVTEHAAMELP